MKIKSIVITVFQFLVISFLFVPTGFAGNREFTDNIYKRITAIQSDSLIKANEKNPNFVILDVRTPGEWNGYHISGSINRSTGLTDFTEQLNLLPKHKIFLLHCQSGSRSAGAFAKMQNQGFSEVYEMIGGISSWRNAGLPTTTIAEPKLMLVSNGELIKGDISDTVKVVVTNRANGILKFEAVSFSDMHQIDNNFNKEIELEGAQDYMFFIIHSPGFSADETTKISFESNGGNVDLNIEFKNGTISGIGEKQFAELTLFPNPANQKLNFKTGGITYFDEIAIVNIAGKEVLCEKQVSITQGIDVSHLMNGIYFARVKSDSRISIRKFVVKH
jgi:rhodanese-related sulfurtransferase